jgi:epoxide hydrolase-like predicted phosphatase
MIKAVLFDFGGVLTESGKKGFVRQALADLYGVKLEDLQLDKQQYEWRKNATDENQVLARLNERFNKNVTVQQFYDHINGDIVRSPEVYSMAEQLRRAGIKTGILSNVFSTSAKSLRHNGFYDNFDPIVLSCEEGYAKPDIELYKIAIERSGVRANEILFVDDQEKCRPPAEALGMHFLLAISPQQIVTDTLAIINKGNGTTL